METKLTQEELDERIAILRRFRSVLEQQRESFQQYLNVLEKQENQINLKNADEIMEHSELEAKIVSNINSLQKVIVPLQQMYQNSTKSYTEEQLISVETIQNDLNKLQQDVLVQNQKNRDLLKTQMNQLRTQIAQFQNPYKNIKSVYAQKQNSGTRIAIDV